MSKPFVLCRATFDHGRKAMVVAAVLAAICAATPATAGGLLGRVPDVGIDPVLPSLPIGGVESANGIDVAVVASIPSRCELGRGSTVDFGELAGGLVFETALGLECNVPFELTVRSANGGLAHVSKPSGEGPFSGRLAYDFGIEVPVLAPAARVLSGRYESRELISGVTLSSADAIAAGGAVLKFETRSPEGVGLLAGEYSETLVLTISPRM